MVTRRTVVGALGIAVSGCVSPRADAGGPGTKAGDGTPTETFDLPPVPEPSERALDRWCNPASGVVDSRLSVLGEALGADRNIANVGFTADGKLHADAPEVVVIGVIDDAAVGEHAYLESVHYSDQTLALNVEEGYQHETGTSTQYGMAMGVRYTLRVSMSEGFPDAVLVRHHGTTVSRVPGPC